MRGILLGLLLSNVVFLAWNFLTPRLVPAAPRVAAVLSDSDSLQLLSEVNAEQLLPYLSAEPLVVVPAAGESVVVELAGQYCAEIGPFRDELDAQGYVSSFGERMDLALDVRELQAAPDYRVYLPPFSSRELAQSTLSTLRAQFAANNIGIDTYLMPRGELANGIALGLFSEQANALNVQRQMEVLGYKVVVRTEPKSEVEVWLLATGMSAKAEFDQHWVQMRLSRSYVDAREKLCETIAHPL